LGNVEQLYLEQKGKDLNTIPLKDEQVFLRKNSNISTGGDSIDFTDEMSEVYKEIALNTRYQIMLENHYATKNKHND